MVRYLPLIWKNSLRNRRRSSLTIFSVAASFCLLGLLFATYRALYLTDPTPAQALRLVTHHRVSLTQAIPASYQQKIREVPGVKEAMIWQWFGGVYRDNRDSRNFFARFAVEPGKFFRVRPEIKLPEDQKQAFIHERTACIATKDLAGRFGWKLGERINLTGDIFPVNLELTLVGIFDDPDTSESLFFSQTYLRESLGNSPRQDMVGSFEVQCDNASDVPRVAEAIDKLFENSPAPTKTESEQAFTLGFVSFLGNVKVFLLSICAAVTFTILLVSANTMAMSVRERIREVGILKTLGYTPGAILGIIVGESAVISVVGGAVGLLLAGGMTAAIRSGPVFIQQLKALRITPDVGGVSLLLAALIGVVSSLIPAWNAARTSILESLGTTD